MSVVFQHTWTLAAHRLSRLHPTASANYYNKLYNWRRRYLVTAGSNQAAVQARPEKESGAAADTRPPWCRAAIWTADSPPVRGRRTQNRRSAAGTAATLCPREFWRICFNFFMKTKKTDFDPSTVTFFLYNTY